MKKGLGDKVRDTLIGVFEATIKGLFSWLKPVFIEDFKTEVAKGTIDEKVFQTDEVKKAIQELKKKWKGSPTKASEIAHDIMDIVVGKVSKIQLQSIADITIDEECPISQKMFNQIAIITDIGLLAATLNIIGEVLSIGQIDRVGDEIRSYLDYSGLSQATGYGYGMILSSVLSPILNQEIMKKTRKAIISPEDAIRMKFKGILKDEECSEILSRHGFTDTDMEKLNEDYLFIPSPADTISWLAREVFEPEMITKWKLDAGFENVKERDYFYKQGLTDEMIRNFWIAHWEHLDYYRIKTLVNRGKLNKEDIKEWCSLQEIAPVWSDEMWELMWEDLTRVDVRRIYNLGLKDEAWLREKLQRVGYKEENLEDMVTFYKSFRLEEYRKLSQSIIIKGVKKEIISPEEGLERLVELGYSPEDAEFILIVELSAASPETSLEFKEITQKYRKAVGLPHKEITKEMKDIEKRIIESKKRLKELEEKKEYGTPYKIVVKGIAELEKQLNTLLKQ